MTFDADVDGLIVLGRQHGSLGTDDLRRALPIEAMSADQIGQVVARLEEAGIDVEIDDNLLSPLHPGPRAAPSNGASIDLPKHDRRSSALPHAGGSQAPAPALPVPNAAPIVGLNSRPGWAAVALIALVAAMVIALIVTFN